MGLRAKVLTYGGDDGERRGREISSGFVYEPITCIAYDLISSVFVPIVQIPYLSYLSHTTDLQLSRIRGQGRAGYAPQLLR